MGGDNASARVLIGPRLHAKGMTNYPHEQSQPTSPIVHCWLISRGKMPSGSRMSIDCQPLEVSARISHSLQPLLMSYWEPLFGTDHYEHVPFDKAPGEVYCQFSGTFGQ